MSEVREAIRSDALLHELGTYVRLSAEERAAVARLGEGGCGAFAREDLVREGEAPRVVRPTPEGAKQPARPWPGVALAILVEAGAQKGLEPYP